MASNKLKLNRKILFQIILILLGILIIFFTYFNNQEQKDTLKQTEKEIGEIEVEDRNISTFENIQYDGVDSNGNKFIINSDYAEFENDKPNIIYMKEMICRFFFKDGTVLRVTSNRGTYDNVSNNMEF